MSNTEEIMALAKIYATQTCRQGLGAGLDAGEALRTAIEAALAEARNAQIDSCVGPVGWISEYGLSELTTGNEKTGSLEWEIKRNHERGHDVPLYTRPAVLKAHG